MDHGDDGARHVVDQRQPLLFGENPEGDEQVVDHALVLQQHDPGSRAHEQRSPERHQHQQQQESGPSRPGVGQQPGQRIRQQQADRGDGGADGEGSQQQAHVDAPVFGLTDDFPGAAAVEIEGVEIMSRRDGLSRAPERQPA